MNIGVHFRLKIANLYVFRTKSRTRSNMYLYVSTIKLNIISILVYKKALANREIMLKLAENRRIWRV